MTLAYRLLIPSSELRPAVAADTSKEGKVVWVPDPGSGLAIEFNVLLARATIGQLNMTYPVEQQLRIMDEFRLANGEGVALVSRVLRMTDDMVAEIRSAGNRAYGQAQAAGIKLTGQRLRGILFVDHSGGGRGIIDVAMPCTV